MLGNEWMQRKIMDWHGISKIFAKKNKEGILKVPLYFPRPVPPKQSISIEKKTRIKQRQSHHQ